MSSCLRKTRTVLSVTKALVCRGMFVLHGLICIWRVTVIKSDVLYWSLAGSLPLVVLETVYTLCKKKNGEWKWVCPSVLLYLTTSVPAIWFLELDVMTTRGVMSSTSTTYIESNMSNDTEDIQLLNGKIHLSLPSEEWCKILEQMLLLILIVGRWLLPKGEITREQLSQLLLVYIGMAADIIELFEAFKEDKVRENKLLNVTILSLWTASLTQFTLVLTATKSKRRRTGRISHDAGDGGASCSNGIKGCCPTEVLSILLSVFLQDAPFLVLRLLLIFRYDVLSYSNIFFTSKNSLVLMLQIYRLVVLFTEIPSPESSKTGTNGRQNVITSGSSRSNSLSLTSNSDSSFSDGSEFGTATSGGYDLTKLRKQRSLTRRGNGNGGLGIYTDSSFDTDYDSIPGTSWMDGKTYLVVTTSKQGAESTGVRFGKGKGKSPRRSPDGVWVCRYQRRQKKKDRESKIDKIKDIKPIFKGNVTRKERSLERQATEPRPKERPLNEQEPRYSSPVLPRAHESLNSNRGNDTAGNCSSYNDNNESCNTNNLITNSNGHNTKTISRCDSKSPKASPSRVKRETSRDSTHQHDSHDEHQRHQDESISEISTTMRHRDDEDGRRKLYRSKSRRPHWSSIKDLQSVLTMLDEKGKYQTVVLKHDGDGTPVYVIDNDKHNITV